MQMNLTCKTHYNMHCESNTNEIICYFKNTFERKTYILFQKYVRKLYISYIRFTCAVVVVWLDIRVSILVNFLMFICFVSVNII